jgi:hypothetical protein
MPRIEISQLSGFLQESLDSESKQLLPEDLCFLVGAGASVAAPTYLPTAYQFLAGFLQVLLERIPEWLISSVQANWQATRESASAPDPHPDFKSYFSTRTWQAQEYHSVWSRLRFETILRTLRLSQFDSDLSLLKIYQRDSLPNATHELLAGFLEHGSHILTTNFDTMIEKIAEGRCLYNYFENSRNLAQQLAEHSEWPLRSILAKLHGTITNKSNFQEEHDRLRTILTTFRRLTKQASSNLIPQDIIADLSTIELVLPRLNPKQKASDPRLDVVNRATSGRILIVLGYSGGDDFDIMPLLMQATRTMSGSGLLAAAVLWPNFIEGRALTHIGVWHARHRRPPRIDRKLGKSPAAFIGRLSI